MKRNWSGKGNGVYDFILLLREATHKPHLMRWQWEAWSTLAAAFARRDWRGGEGGIGGAGRRAVPLVRCGAQVREGDHGTGDGWGGWR
jgi:hypothetical protein